MRPVLRVGAQVLGHAARRVPGHPRDDVGHRRQLTGGDGQVAAHPALDLPVRVPGGAAGRPTPARPSAAGTRGPAGDCSARTAAASASVSASGPVTSRVRPARSSSSPRRDGGRDIGEVVPRDEPGPALATGRGDDGDAVLQRGEERDEVGVHAVPEDGGAQARRRDRVLRGGVLPGEREGRLGGGAHEGRVHDPPHPGCRGRRHRCPVLLEAVGRLGRRHQVDGVGAGERRSQTGPVGVPAGSHGDLRAGQRRSTTGDADDEPQRGPGRGQPRRHPAAEDTGRAGHGDGARRARCGSGLRHHDPGQLPSGPAPSRRYACASAS